MKSNTTVFVSILSALLGTSLAGAQVAVPQLDYQNGVGPETGRAPAMALRASASGQYVEFRGRAGSEVVLDWAMLSSFDPQRPARITLPDLFGSPHEIVLLHCDYRSEQDYEWVGQIAGRPYSDVFLARYQDGFHAVIRDYDNGLNWSIEGDAAGRFYVVDGDSGIEVPGPVCSPSTSRPSIKQAPEAGLTRGERSLLSVSDPLHTVDIMTVATLEVLQNIGANNFVTACRVAVADFNNRAINSRVTSWSPGYVTLRLVAVDTVSGQDYSEVPQAFGSGESFGGDVELDQLYDWDSPLSEEIGVVREDCRADLVALCRWTPWRTSATGSDTVGGVAWRPDSQAGLDERGLYWSVNSMAHASLDFVGDIFPHEVGHNMALVHDLLQYLLDIEYDYLSGELPPAASELSSRPHGFKDTCTLGCVVGDLNFHTTMAYGVSSSCGRSTLTPFFSSPFYSYDPGALCASRIIGDSNSWASELMVIAAQTISANKVGASQRWVASGGSGMGTMLDPFGSVLHAVNDVQGDVGEAVVRIRSGQYVHGFPIVLNNTATLQAEGGSVVIK